MKKHLLIILFFSTFIFFACEKENTPTPNTVKSSINANSELTGTIENIGNAEIDSIQVQDVDGFLLGKGSVTHSGEFSVKLTDNMSLSVPVSKFLIYNFEGTISNNSANISYGTIICYKAGKAIGALRKCNYPEDQTSDSVGLSSIDYEKSDIFGKVGSSASIFIYSSKSVIIKGTGTDEVFKSISSGINEDSFKYRYNLTLNEGWNEITLKYTKYSTSSTAYIFEIEISKSITSDLKWRFYKSDNPEWMYSKYKLN